MHMRSKYTFVEVDSLSNLDGGINEAKTSDKDKLSEIPYRYIPPYFFKDKLGPSGEFLSLLQSALKNNVDSQHRLSNMYFDGIKVEKDHLAGYWWLLRAANNGYRYSWLIMADMLSRFNYCYRDIISRDKYKAVQWYRKYNSRIYLIQCYKERYNVFLSNQDRNKSVTQLVAEADESLNKLYQKGRDEEDRIEESLNSQSKLKRFKRTRNPSKEQLRENFDPFIFHPKRK